MGQAATQTSGGADRRLEQRLRLVLPGRFTTQSRYDSPCVTQDVSPSGLGMLCSTPPRHYEEIELRLRDLGTIWGTVVRLTPSGFGVAITRTELPKLDLARLMISLSSSQRERPDNDSLRQAERIVPLLRDSTLHLKDGRQVPTRIANFSATGAAISLPEGLLPDVGSTVIVGRKAAKVVRHTEGGMGVAFVRPFDPTTFNDRVIL